LAVSKASAFRFLCGCLSVDESPQWRDKLKLAAQSESFEWEEFVEVACNHLVEPAVGDRFQAKGIAEAIPSDVIDFFNGIATLNRLRNERIIGQAIELTKILNALEVVPVFMKGAANLLSGLYADPAHRTMVDIDVLVPAERLLDCVANLRVEGYEALFDNDFPAHHHYPPLARPGVAATIELHVEPLDKPVGKLMDAAEVFAGMRALDQDAATFALPSPDCRIIQSIAHAQLSNHDYVYGRFSLRELFELSRFNQVFGQEIDWNKVSNRFASCGAAAALGFHVRAAERLLDVRIDDAVKVSTAANVFYRRAEWQIDHPRWLGLSTRLLQPWLLLFRSLSQPILRRRLLRKLRDAAWYRRQWGVLMQRSQGR
jgi:hypothetical protein